MRKHIFLCSLLISFFYLNAEVKIIPYEVNGKFGLLDSNLQVLLSPKYDSFISCSKNLSVFSYQYKYIVINSEGIELYNGNPFNQPVLIGNNKYSITTEINGNKEIDYVTHVCDENNQLLEELLNIEIRNSDENGNLYIVNPFNQNLSRYYIIDADKKYLFPNMNFKRIFYYDSTYKIALVKDEYFSDKLVSVNNEFVNKTKFMFAMRSFNEGLVFGKNLETNVTGFYDIKCRLIIKIKIKDTSDMDDWNTFPCFSCGLISVVNQDNEYLLLSEYQSMDSKNWILMDVYGNIVKDGIEANKIYPFVDNVAVLRILKNNDYKYQLISNKGEILTNEYYDRMYDSVNGFCRAKKNGKDYLISVSTGKVYDCEEFK